MHKTGGDPAKTEEPVQAVALLPHRVLVVARAIAHIKQIRSALLSSKTSLPGYAIHASVPEHVAGPLAQAESPEIVILVQPEAHQLLGIHSFQNNGRVPVIVIGRKGTRADAVTLGDAGLSGYLGADELHRLPALTDELLSGLESGSRAMARISIEKTDALRESQKLISIGRLAAEIAHEINNPLESVGNLLYLAQLDGASSESASEYLRDAERELARVVQISKQTLSFYRESPQPVPVELNELMDEVVSMYSRRIRSKKISIHREFSGNSVVTVLPGEMRQVFSNLVTNAIEALEHGGKLRLRIHSGSQHGEAGVRQGLRICIGDNGSGIPAEARRRLGELFFTTKGQAGTGLGLWVTKAIVTRYGGTLRLKSATGDRHGTIFQIFLPVDIADRRETERRGRKSGNVTEISAHPSHNENLPGAAESSRSDGREYVPRKRKG